MKSGNKTVVRSAARTVRGRNGPTEKSEERTQRGEATRQLLLDAAERMFAERGVEGVVILDGKLPHAVLIELLTDHGAGTLITR